MVKKLGFVAVLLVGAVVLLNTTYASLGWKKAKAIFDRQISPETKLELIKEEVANLDKVQKQFVSEVAKETVTVRKMRREIDQAEADQKVNLDKILTMKKDLAKGETFIVYAGRNFSRDMVEQKFNGDWEQYKRTEQMLKHKKDELNGHERSLLAAEERLREFQGKREELESQVAKLQAELQNIQLAKSQSKFSFDDSKVGDVKKKMSELQDYVDEEKVKLEVASKVTSVAIPVGEKAPVATDTMKEVDDYVATQNGPKVEAKAPEASKAVDSKDVK